MPLIEWTDAYSVGYKIFDDQHRKLFSILNALHDAMKSGKGRELLGKTLAELVDYAAVHFKAEEALFATHSYAFESPHRKEHADLTRQALDLQKKFQAGAVLSMEVMQFLRNWLDTHILGTDMKYKGKLGG